VTSVLFVVWCNGCWLLIVDVLAVVYLYTDVTAVVNLFADVTAFGYLFVDV
jgi:hypothetical protein